MQRLAVHAAALAAPPPPRLRRAARHARCAAAPAPAAAAAVSDAQEAFHRLADAAGLRTSATLAAGVNGFALVAARDVEQGDVLLELPLDACIRFLRCPDTRRTLRWAAPDAAWPRTCEALEAHAEEGLPWDLVAACCMLDALAGDGGAFWAAYASALLPPPGALTLPLLLRDDALAALAVADAEVAAAAVAQRQRLAEVLPWLAAASPPLAHGFALVRSRAFSLGGNTFACVPFCDLINHSARPSAELLVPFADDGTIANDADAAAGAPRVRVVARKPLRRGEEVTLCYDASYDNARLMALHGFVPAEGNRVERVPLPAALASLRLDWLQESMGDAAWMDMLLGDDARTYAALSSLPTRNDEAGGEGAREQRAAAAALRAAVASAQAALPTSLAHDEAALADAERARDAHTAAALRFRLEPKRMWARCDALLAAYEAALASRA